MSRYHRATDNQVLSETISPGVPGQIEGMRLHLDNPSATSEDLTVTLVSAIADQYDVVLFRQDMDTVQDLHWQPTRPIVFSRGDSIAVAWDNTNTEVYGLEFVWSGLGV